MDLAALNAALEQANAVSLGIGFVAGFLFSFNSVAPAAVLVSLACVTKAHETGKAVSFGIDATLNRGQPVNFTTRLRPCTLVRYRARSARALTVSMLRPSSRCWCRGNLPWIPMRMIGIWGIIDYDAWSDIRKQEQ